MSTNGSVASPGTEAPSDTHDGYKRTNSFKDNDKYMRTRSGTYVRRDSDSYNRKESAGMPDFRSKMLELDQKLEIIFFI